jgi:hypothetical protein
MVERSILVLTDEADIHQVRRIKIIMPRALNDLAVVQLVAVTERTTSSRIRRDPIMTGILDLIAGVAKVAMQIVDDTELACDQRYTHNDLKKHEKSERPADNPTQHGVGRQGERSAGRQDGSRTAHAQAYQPTSSREEARSGWRRGALGIVEQMPTAATALQYWQRSFACMGCQGRCSHILNWEIRVTDGSCTYLLPITNAARPARNEWLSISDNRSNRWCGVNMAILSRVATRAE